MTKDFKAPLYKGITFLLSKPSRFDQSRLLTGYGGEWFQKILHPYLIFNVDVRTVEQHRTIYNNKFSPGTKVVVLCDPYAIDKYLPGKKDPEMNEVRGNVYEGEDKIVYIPTYAPQNAYDFLNREYPKDEENLSDELDKDEKNHGGTQRKNFRFWFYQDVKKALRILEKGITKPAPFTHHNPAQISLVTKILHSSINEDWVIDIETTINYGITVLSIGRMSTREVFVIPISLYDKAIMFSEEDYRIFFKVLQKAFDENRWIAHNGSFDFFILAWRFKLSPPLRMYDTMIAQHRMSVESEKSLGHCISHYLDLPYHKDEGCFEPHNHWQQTQLWDYNAKDVETTAWIYEAQEVVLGKDKELRESVVRGNSFIRPFLFSALHGIKVDRAGLTKERERLDRLYTQQQRILNILVGYDLNANSPLQVGEYLFDFKGLGKKYVKRKTNSETLIRLLRTNKIPAIRCLLSMRKLAKDRGVLDFAAWGKNGDRFTSSIKPAGTKTMRNASSALLVFKRQFTLASGQQRTAAIGYGSNVQNITKSLRKFFIPDANKILVNVDQAGAEALVVAYLSPPGRYRKLFLNGVKPHSFIAMHLFAKEFAKLMDMKMADYILGFLNVEVEELVLHKRWKELAKLIKDSDGWEGKRYYYLGKKVCHASNYGMGFNTFINSIMEETDGAIVLTAKEAKAMLAMYYSLFPEIAKWHVEVKQQLAINRTLTNLFGDRRVFNAPTDDAMYRDAYSWVPQSTIGVLTNVGIQRLEHAVIHDPKMRSVDFLVNVHDSMMSQCDIGKELMVAKEMSGYMEEEFTTKHGTFTIRCEGQVGYNWKDLEDVEI